jgi:hypothetical protein
MTSNKEPEETRQEPQNEKLLRLMTGYDQHASPFNQHTAYKTEN